LVFILNHLEAGAEAEPAPPEGATLAAPAVPVAPSIAAMGSASAALNAAINPSREARKPASGS